MKLISSYCGPPKSPSPVRVSYIWYDLDREVFMSVCVEPRKEVPRKHQDTSRNRIRKPIGNSSTIVPDTDYECPRSEAKGMNLMFPTGPVLCLGGHRHFHAGRRMVVKWIVAPPGWRRRLQRQ